MTVEQTYQLLQRVVSQMDVVVKCQSVTDNSDGTYTFSCAKTKWAGMGFMISILGNEYEIINVVFNTSITVRGAVMPTALTFDLYRPIFKHGSLITVASELNALPGFRDRLPLIWLKEIVTERLHFDLLDAVDSDNDAQLFFATSANFADWDQIAGDTNGIAPMRAMVSEFVRALSISQFVGEMTSTGEVKNYNKFGTYSDNGTIRNYFNEPLCAVGLRVTIPFLKECDCCNNPTLDTRPAPGYVIDIMGNILAILYSNEYYVSTGGVCAGVTITDQDGNILSTVPSGGNYDVTVLTQISDTVDDNEATIIDDLT